MNAKLFFTATLSSLLFMGCGSDNTSTFTSKDLGEKLFHDTTLSKNETMSC